MTTFTQYELGAANAARHAIRTAAYHYAPQDEDAAVMAALVVALEQEAAAQGRKIRLLYGCEE